MATPFRVEGSQGVSLAGVFNGPEGAPPIVFLHGFAQGHQAFRRTLEGPLAERFRLIAVDLRGHGGSDKPEAAEAYADGARWAEDVDAVLRAAGRERPDGAALRPVIVAWSYGGVVLGDYLRRFGGEALGGVVFVGATPGVGRPAREWLGPAMLAHARGMLAEAAADSEAAARAFLREATASPQPEAEIAGSLAIMSQTPVHVRRAMFARSESYEAELRALRRPVLVVQGALDRVISQAAAQYVGRTAPEARVLVYEEVGHMPFVERAERFERDLGDFVLACQTTPGLA